MSVEAVVEAWDRIETWCREHHPRLLQLLNPGASKDEVTSVEDAIGQPLPEDVRESLLIHNGQSSANPGFLFGSLTLATCERIAWEYSNWKGSDSGSPPTGYTFFPKNAIAYRDHEDLWIPVAYEDGCGNCLAIDLAPGTAGIRGQVIMFGADIFNLGVLAPSWGEFLLSYAKLLESGVVDENTGDVNNWSEDFYPVFDRSYDGSLVLWAMDGRWPMLDFNPTWRTETVIALAKRIDETRDFATMPLLADALEEAGCDSFAVLSHCRGTNCTHEQGCWLIDRLLRGRVGNGRWCSTFPG